MFTSSVRPVIWDIVVLIASGVAVITASEQGSISKSIVRPNANADSGFYVVFCARDGLPGHAFVVWGREDPSQQASSQDAFGLYSAKGGKALTLGTVPGEIRSEAVRSPTIRLIVRVTQREYGDTRKILEDWAAKGEYKLAEHDCVSFIEAVAKSIGLQTPDRGKIERFLPKPIGQAQPDFPADQGGPVLPIAYLRELAKLND